MSQSSFAIQRWREEYARRMLRLDFEPEKDSQFHARSDTIVEGIRLASSSFSAGFTVRDAELVRDSEDSIALVIARSGRIFVDKAAQQLELGSGEAGFLSVCEPGRLGAATAFSYAAFIMPADELRARLPANQHPVRAAIPRQMQSLRLLRTYLRSLEAGKRIDDPDCRATIQQHLLELAALCAGKGDCIGESKMPAVAAARLAIAKTIIAEHLTSPSLSISFVAGLMGISTRYLQKLFLLEEMTFTRYVSDQRLDYAMTILQDKSSGTARISDIAYRAGYSDLSYFDRSFKRRFGERPSELRFSGLPSLMPARRKPEPSA